MQDLSTIPGRIKFAMYMRGLVGPNALEKTCNLSKGEGSRLLRGKRPETSVPTLEKLADGLNAEFSWLATGKGKAPTPDPAPKRGVQESPLYDLAGVDIRRDFDALPLEPGKDVVTYTLDLVRLINGETLADIAAKPTNGRSPSPTDTGKKTRPPSRHKTR